MTDDERETLIQDVSAVVRTRIKDKQLTDEETEWVRLAIQRQRQSIVFRQAVIEKTTGALIWSAIAGFSLLLLDGLKAHGWK